MSVPATTAAPRAASPDVAALAVAASRGDEEAFGAIFRWLAPIVHGVAVARGAVEEADDVVQETFLVVYRRLGSLRDPAALAGWVRAVAANLVMDRHRRRARAPRLVAVPEDAPARASPRADDDAVLRRAVLARLQELPEPYRETLVWRLVEGLDGPGISERTGLTPGSVRVNLCRGLALLRPLLAKDGWR